MDSLFGHRNERYLRFGWAAARLDDVANYIPARLTLLVLTISGYVTGLNIRNAIRIAARDARKHPSPNSGISEAFVAGGLETQLGGTLSYDGIQHERPLLGDAVRSATLEMLPIVTRFIFLTAVLSVCMGVIIRASATLLLDFGWPNP